MNALAGTGALVRLALRRDRVVLPVWLAVFVLMAMSAAAGTIALYPTAGSWVGPAETWNHSQSLVALYGQVYDSTSVGSLAVVKPLGTMAAILAVFAIILMVRHTRAEEETGRLELLGATVVGRHAPLAAALLVAIGTNLVLGLLAALGMISTGLSADGSFAFGAAWAGVGIAFAAIAAVVAQLTRSARAATGISVAVVGVVYVLRAVGDTVEVTGPSWLTWLSPIGWAQQFRPYAGNRWWVLLVVVGFAVVAVAAAHTLVARRDLGAGLVADRAGPATATRTLRSPLALAWRLHRGLLLSWATGFTLVGLLFGNLASNIGDFFDSSQARDVLAKLGGEQGLTDAYLVAMLGMVGIAASAYGIQAAMRLRAEESALHAEPLLATAVGRVRWAASHVTIAVLGTTLLMVAMGASAGLAHGARVGDMSQVGRVLGGALVQLPAAWVLTGIVVAAFGLAPRLVTAGWAALVGFLLLAEVGPLLDLDQWVMDVSPYAHVPKIPGAELTVAPVVTLTAVAALLTAAGLAGFRRRDIG
ncbi:MAG TPA: ABC transporter permease [Micromonosporaceae bacterium]|nr:ABC transporter permease [Micromonosporaceae bacterium]